jgi:two-component system response regulator AtoC
MTTATQDSGDTRDPSHGGLDGTRGAGHGEAPRAPGEASSGRLSGASRRVIVCDDEELIRWSVSEHLRAEGYAVTVVKNGLECLEEVTRGAPDAVLLDLRMPVMDGMTCLRRIRESGLQVPVVVLTAHGAVDSAIEATHLGASAYLSKPFDLREVSLKLQAAIASDQLVEEVRYLRGKRQAHYGAILGDSPAMQRVFDTLRRLEGVDVPTVLVTGESGTGKELIAQAIHALGPRREAPFVEIDCASLPETLIESELFGHERGSFTDARQMKRGLFEVARGGTIFLDEIGEMSPATQAKLLRALESRRFKRVGGVADLPLEAGIVAATNRDLALEVEAGRFRQDLFYRLAIIPIALPALRERTGDVALLAAHFFEHFKKRVSGVVEGFEPLALEALGRYPWPGNVRELRNVVERLVTLHRGEALIRFDQLPDEIRSMRLTRAGAGSPAGVVGATGWSAASGFGPLTGASPASSGLAAPAPSAPRGTEGPGTGRPEGAQQAGYVLPAQGVNLEEVERSLITQALERTRGNQTAAAKLLGITRYALRYRLEKFEMKA